jgi:hypothetical protein
MRNIVGGTRPRTALANAPASSSSHELPTIVTAQNPVAVTSAAAADAFAQAAATIDQANGIDLPSSARPEPGLGAESVETRGNRAGSSTILGGVRKTPPNSQHDHHGASVKNDETLSLIARGTRRIRE